MLIDAARSSGERLSNGLASVRLYVPSSDSSSDVWMICCSQGWAADTGRQCTAYSLTGYRSISAARGAA